MFYRLRVLVFSPILFLLSACGTTTDTTEVVEEEEPECDGSITHIVGGWVSDNFKGQRNALLIRPDGKAEYTFTESKPPLYNAAEQEFERVFPDSAAVVTWTIDLEYEGDNTWYATNPVQVKGPRAVPFPEDDVSGWAFDQSWRLEKGYLVATDSEHRYIPVREWARHAKTSPSSQLNAVSQ